MLIDLPLPVQPWRGVLVAETLVCKAENICLLPFYGKNFLNSALEIKLEVVDRTLEKSLCRPSTYTFCYPVASEQPPALN